MPYLNMQENPVITSGYPGSSGATAAERRILRRALDPEDVERAAVLLCAEAGGLRIDEAIFRRRAPAGCRNAFVLALTGEDVPQEGCRYRLFKARLSGCDGNAAVLHQKFALVHAGLPGDVFTSVASRRITGTVHFARCTVEKTAFDVRSEQGCSVTTGVMELSLLVCVAP